MAYRLLIVPGDNQTLRALPDQFAGDVQVQVLDSANDALWEVRQSAPEAIIADIDLPGMSGLDLAEILPNFGVSTRVVLWSREPNNQAAKQAAGHGVHQFLNGPLSPAQLKTILYEVMRQVATTPVVEEPAAPVAPTPAAPVTAPTPPPTPRTATRSADPAPARAAEPAPARSPDPAPARAADPVPERPRRERPAPPPPSEPERPRRERPEPPPIIRRSSRRRAGPLVLTAENLTPIQARMTELLQEVGAQCIILTDRNGMVLTEVGKTAGIPTMILLPMLSTSFSAAGQISQMLRETDSNALYMQEGSFYDLYCFDLLQSFMLVLIFDKAASATKIGTVWVYAKRATRDMQEHLS